MNPLARKRRSSEKNRGFLISERKNKQISEQYRTIRTNINFSSINKEIKTIVVTSPTSGDGKTITASNLAIVFSQDAKRVLLVDADMRRPTVHYTFGLQNNHFGLSNYLVNGADFQSVIRNTHINDLDVVTSGIIPPNPSELLGSKRMSEFIEKVKSIYDIVIFDTPPILSVSDSTIIANQCDGVLLVVRTRKSEMKDVQKARELLLYAKANLIGAVLNGKKNSSGDHYYYE